MLLLKGGVGGGEKKKTKRESDKIRITSNFYKFVCLIKITIICSEFFGDLFVSFGTSLKMGMTKEGREHLFSK